MAEVGLGGGGGRMGDTRAWVVARRGVSRRGTDGPAVGTVGRDCAEVGLGPVRRRFRGRGDINQNN